MSDLDKIFKLLSYLESGFNVHAQCIFRSDLKLQFTCRPIIGNTSSYSVEIDTRHRNNLDANIEHIKHLFLMHYKSQTLTPTGITERKEKWE